MIISDRNSLQFILVEREFIFRLQHCLVNEAQLGKEMQTGEAAIDKSCLSVAAGPFHARFCKYTLSVPQASLLSLGI